MHEDIKILALDIETSPILAWVWGLWDQNVSIGQIKEDPRIIAFSAQWYDKTKVMFWSEYHHTRQEMLQAFYDLLDEADIVLGYNSVSFDIVWIEGELVSEGFERPSPFKQIDLLRIARKHTKFPSKKLDYVALRLLGDRKEKHPGMQMWIDCLEGDEATKKKAWKIMKSYALKDTALLFPLFEALRPYIKMPFPVSDDPLACPNCGSHKYQKRGFQRTSASRYQRYQCGSCGGWFHDAKREPLPTQYRAI